MRLVTFASEIYHSFQNACRVIQRSGSEKSFGMLGQFVFSHSSSKHLTAWIWSSKKYYSVKPWELPVFPYRHKESVQLFGEVFWFTNISRSLRECRESILFQFPLLQSFFRKIPFSVRESSSELKESSSELKESSLELKECSSELKESSSKLKESSSEVKQSSLKLKESSSELKESFSEVKECTLEINRERSPNLTKSTEHRERLPDIFRRGFEKETALLIPTTPSLKAMEENCGTMTDQKLCIGGGKLMETTSQPFRLTVRNIARFPVCKRNFRDREPSRVPVKKFLQILSKRKLRRNAKRVIKHSTPTSSNLHWLVTDFKLWYVSFLHRRECFFSQFLNWRKKHPRFNTSYCHDIEINTFCSNNLKSEHYCSTKRKLLLSNDVEINPGPDKDESNQVVITFVPDPLRLLEQRLYLLGMRPLDVGGAGDCLFRAVSHQLYGHPDLHFDIRISGVEYMRENPERFIESNSENSWSEYLGSMSRKGTWADGLIIQAIADKHNLKIHIIESNPNFTEFTIVQAVNPVDEVRPIYIGHLNEYHYVSSLPLTQSLLEKEEKRLYRKGYMRNYRQDKEQNTDRQTPKKKRTKSNDNSGNNKKQPNNDYFREYMKRRRLEVKQKKQIQAEEADSTNIPHNLVSRQNCDVTMKHTCNKEHDSILSCDYDDQNMGNLIKKFHAAVSRGPMYICTCCDQLWYKHSVNNAQKVRLSNPNAEKYLLSKISVDNVEWICQTCDKYLKKNKIPPCAAKNGMSFPVKPDFFDLNELECRLVAPRLAFQKLVQAPRGNQLKIKGNVVNVPADVNNTVNIIPRLPQETGTIKVQLKRRLKFKGSALSLNVRPDKILQAANWLVTNSSLYREEGVTLSKDKAAALNLNLLQNHTENQDCFDANDQIIDTCSLEKAGKETGDFADDWTEGDAGIPEGLTDTMLTATDFLEDSERAQIYNIAPGEGSVPLSIFRDRYSEELAYPGIFLGQKRPENEDRLVDVQYSEICKSELRRSDRRAAMCVENIFFKAKKLQMKIILGKSQIALRKCKGNKRALTAGQLKQQGTLERLVHLDEGYKFLRALRGSPPYFEKAKKDIFAMIRQLGPATLFCSFSSAETQWTHLLRILGKLVDKKEYSDKELENLNWEEKCRLIQGDPVTCARHFDYQFNQFLKTFLISSGHPLGKIADWFYRVEYQQRG